eukprot:TRINITY_DN9596_c0_g1_i3.p1 TRINITY_DN9596_c0_g1~~TRINITY_DN9596_c0_g1_i3.p1  ORF type:complete len:490 (+),score=170.00 TRINITY_DN9596_c0_g1_i3:79-1548(+)
MDPLTLTVFLLIAIVALVIVRQRYELSPNAKVAEGSIPILGHSLLVSKHQETLLEWLWAGTEAAGGKSWQFKIIGQSPFVCILDPENVKHVLYVNFDNYVKGTFFRDKFTELLGKGIFNADGAEWNYQRKTASHLFKRKELSGFMTQTFVDHCNDVLVKLEQAADADKVIDLQDLFYRYTLESIGKIAFGTNLGCFEHDKVEFAVNFDTAQRIIMERVFDPAWPIRRWLTWIHPSERTLTRCVNNLDAFARQVITERRQAGDLAEREDLLSRFMNVKDEQGKPLNDDRLRDVVMSFVIAGRDTTANCLAWVFYELHQHPDVKAKLQKEIDEVLGDREPEHDDIHTGMPYLHAVVKETLRLHPSVPKDGKVALKDDTLPDGTKIKAGNIVVYMPWVMGRSNSIWDNATTFDPERWLKGEPEPSAFKYTAFNAGPRLCLGMNMAYLEAKFLVAKIMQRYEVEVQSGQDFAYQVTLTMPIKNGLFAKLKARA